MSGEKLDKILTQINGISRRDFVKLSSALTSWMALSGSSTGLLRAAEKAEERVSANKGVKIIPTSCAYDHGGRCVLRAHVKDGVIIRFDTDIEPDSINFPQIRACWRGRAHRKKIYSPYRIKYPMKRVGERGEGKFKRITWDEAYDILAKQMTRIKEKYGRAAIFDGGYAGQYGSAWGELYSPNPLLYWALSKRFLNIFGSRVGYWDTYSLEGSLFASKYMFGINHFWDSNEADDLLNSRLIILWGFNPCHSVFGTNTSYYLMLAKEKGIRFYSIDPEHNTSAAAYRAKWIPIKPGTDSAMAIAMAYVMIEKEIYDKKFIEKFTHGFDKYKDYVMGKTDGVPKTPDWAEKITGVPAKTIIDLAIEYATTKPSALISSNAPQRTAYGEEYHRAALTLTAMTGNIGIHGGYTGALHGGFPLKGPGVLGPTIDASLDNDLKKKYTDMLKTDPVRALLESDEYSSKIRIAKFADAVLLGEKAPKELIGCPSKAEQPNIRMAWFLGINFVGTTMNVNKTIEAMKSKNLEFIVVNEGWMNFTAKFADLILPINTIFERDDDIVIPWLKGHYIIYRNNCIKPLYESKNDLQILTELSERLGFRKEFNPFNTIDELMDEYLKRFNAEWGLKLKRSELKERGLYKFDLPEPWIAFKDQIQNGKPFNTPSGKIEIYSDTLANMNFKETKYGSYIPPIPTYREAWESGNDPLAKKYPLQLITPHPRFRTHSQFWEVPWLREVYNHELIINTKDAVVRGIKDGDMVRIWNDRGKVSAVAKVTERIMPGVVRMYHGTWPVIDKDGTDLAGNPNFLTNDRPSPAGSFPKNTVLVEVGRYDDSTTEKSIRES